MTKIIQNKAINNKLTLAKATLNSHKMEIELESLREKTSLDKLEFTKKRNEIEISEQSKQINELELIKNQYASIALLFLLVICLFVVLFIFRSFIASKRRNKELDYLASRDPLTNCYNRRRLFEVMDKYFLNHDLDKEYCIIMVDMDHFKDVNDAYGHSTGDIVISDLAAILQGCIRQNDIVARYGGEEFCIVLHQTSQIQAMIIAQTMRYKIENSTFNSINVTSNFGVASLHFGAKSPSQLIEQADVALYQSKSLGRNKVTLWDESIHTSN